MNRLSNAYWSAHLARATWDGVKWNSVNVGSPPGQVHHVELDVTGTWKNGYRPNTVLLDGSWSDVDPDVYFAIQDTGTNDVFFSDGFVSKNVDLELAFPPQTADLAFFIIMAPASFNLTKMEFVS